MIETTAFLAWWAIVALSGLTFGTLFGLAVAKLNPQQLPKRGLPPRLPRAPRRPMIITSDPSAPPNVRARARKAAREARDE